MADQRKPSEQPYDSLTFSIETTSMRLKSLKVRRAEAADRAVEESLRGDAPSSVELPETRGPSAMPAGRVRHDERGMAVWDWAVASGEFAALSATNIMRKLEVTDLKIEETQRAMKIAEVPESAAAGDPYNQRVNKSAESYNPYDPHAKPIPGAPPGGDPYNTRGAPPRAAGTFKRPQPSQAPARKTDSSRDQPHDKKK
jgi:hypothetical protein